jgi:HK97 family phage portal protein
MADGNLLGGVAGNKKPLASFFNGILGVVGYLGAGWYPTGSREGSAPFRQVSSDAGPTITPGSALQLSAFFACCKLISETVATLPLELKQIDAEGNATLLTNSSTFRMLNSAPNPDMTAVEFWEMMVAGLCTWGNSYAEKGRIAGRVVSLTPLRPEYMTVYRDINGQILYAYARGTQMQIYTQAEMLHIKAFGVDGLVGLSPVAMARQTLGRSLATDQASGSIFLNGLSAGGFIEYAQALKPQQREEIRQSLQKFTGSSNMGKIMVLENGMSYSPITMNPSDAQMLETRAWNVEEVCRWLAVPPQLIGQTSKSSSWASSLENTILWFTKTCLRAYLTRIEQSVTRSLALGPSYQLAFNLDALERGDTASRVAYNASGAQNGYLTRNEIREREGEPRSADPMADKLTIQSNLIPLEKVGTLGGQQGSADKPVTADPTGTTGAPK